jgi:hypothetical protein
MFKSMNRQHSRQGQRQVVDLTNDTPLAQPLFIDLTNEISDSENETVVPPLVRKKPAARISAPVVVPPVQKKPAAIKSSSVVSPPAPHEIAEYFSRTGRTLAYQQTVTSPNTKYAPPARKKRAVPPRERADYFSRTGRTPAYQPVTSPNTKYAPPQRKKAATDNMYMDGRTPAFPPAYTSPVISPNARAQPASRFTLTEKEVFAEKSTFKFDWATCRQISVKFECNKMSGTAPTVLYAIVGNKRFRFTYDQTHKPMCGTFGVALVYRCDNLKLVLKIHNDDNEYYHVNRLRTIACEQVNALVYIVTPGCFNYVNKGRKDPSKHIFATVMPYYDGSLNMYRGGWTFDEINTIVTKVYSTVQCLHDKHYMYLDIKPENILVRNNRTEFTVSDIGGDNVSSYRGPLESNADQFIWLLCLLIGNLNRSPWFSHVQRNLSVKSGFTGTYKLQEDVIDAIKRDISRLPNSSTVKQMLLVWIQKPNVLQQLTNTKPWKQHW